MITRQRLLPLPTLCAATTATRSAFRASHTPCIFCQRIFLSTTARRAEASKTASRTDSDSPKYDDRSPEWRHQRYKDGELIPKPLSRPLGLPHPPESGQNDGIDKRTFAQRRDDFTSYGQHKERQKRILIDVFEKNYYRDIGNLGKIHKGKSILAPSTPFKSSLALYFPNLTGASLERGGIFGVEVRDTTPVLKGKISIVSMINTEWANEQVATFISEKDNPALHDLIRSYPPAKGLVQFATVSVEENFLKAWMIKLFWSRIKKIVPKEQHHLYFLNRKGITDEIRDGLGMWNSKVGYVYLLDGQCRVRWAGNGNSRPDERNSLVTCIRRLVDEARGVQKMRIERQEPRPTPELRPPAKGKLAAVVS